MKLSAEKQGDLSLDHYEIGLRHRFGQGVVEDHSEAFRHFEESAKAGNREAQYRMALMYLDGVGVSKDPAKARELLIEVANTGHQGAKEDLEKIYRYGIGVEKDPVMADMWGAKAAI